MKGVLTVSILKKGKKARIIVFLMAAVMVLAVLAPMTARADDTLEFNHGTIAVNGNASTTLRVGQSMSVTISPYLHMQTAGCCMWGECPGICGGTACFTPGQGCVCDPTPALRNAKVTAQVVSGSASTVSIGNVTAASQPAAVGQMADGTLVITANSPGTVQVKVTAKGHNPGDYGVSPSEFVYWTSAEKTFTITVR